MFRQLYLVALLLGLSQVASATYLLTAPPRESPEQGAKLYQPLAKLLTEALGEPVRYQHPGGWSQYERNMQNGSYDFVFDGPHFVAWRMVHLKHQPLVALPGELRFSLYVRADDEGVAELYDLKFGKVCSLPPPHLSAVVVMAEFDGVSRPRIVPGQSGMAALYQRFGAGDCRAVVLSERFVSALDPAERDSLRSLFDSPALPNQAFTAGPRVPSERYPQLVELLTGAEANSRLAGLFAQFGNVEEAHFVAAQAERFEGFNRLLEGVVWGW